MRGAAGTGNVDVLEHGVLRAAAWPIEIIDRFAAPELAARAAETMVARAGVVARRPSSVAALERVVPTLPARDQRALVLKLKRHIHGTVAPLGAIPRDTIASIVATAPELHRLLQSERQARDELAVLEDELDRAHREETARQRAVLLDITSDGRFLRALSVAHPALAERWERRIVHGLTDRPPSKARERRLEATVLRYLLRAAGRATPHSAWAGVAPVEIASPSANFDVEPGKHFSVSAAPAGYRVSPDLDPFAKVVAVLARRRRYWEDYPMRLEPTVHRVDTTWWYEHAGPGGREWVPVPDDPLLAVVVEAYQDGTPHRAAPLLDALAALVPERDTLRGLLDAAVERLVALGVLQSELVMPAAPSSVWEALHSVLAGLVEPDRSLWREVVATIRHHCARLERCFDTLEPAEVREIHNDVASEIRRLEDAAGCHDVPVDRVLHLDMRLPFKVTWSAATLVRLRTAVVEVLGFHMAAGAAERLRSESVSSTLATVGPGAEVSLASLLRAVASGNHFGPRWPSRVTAWDDLLVAHRSQAVCTLPAEAVHPRPRPGPSGALLFSIAVRDQQSEAIQLRVEWGRPQPAMFLARWHELLGADAGEHLQHALARQVAGWDRDGVRAIEIVGSDAANLSAAVRPRLAQTRLQPHGRSDLRLADLSVVVEHDRAWFRHAERDAWYVPVYDSAAAIGFDDPCSRLLLQLAMSHGWELLALGSVPLTGALGWPHVPRVELPGGTVLSGEQWRLDREAVAALTASSGSAQYLAWREHVERLALPERVWVGPADGFDPERLPLRSDSPLAVRCLFEELARDPRAVVLVEAHGDPLDWPVRDEQGGHHVAELAVSWFDDDHWRALRNPRDVGR